MCLDLEENSPRAAKLMAGLRAIGKPGVPSLLQLLESSRPVTLVHALSILSDVGHGEVVPKVVPLLEHPEEVVRASAIAALSRLGGPEAAPALESFFPGAGPAQQLECLEALGVLKSPDSVKLLADFLAEGKSGDAAGSRVRLRAVETLLDVTDKRRLEAFLRIAESG